VRLDFASDLMRRAMPWGRVTLCRMGFSMVGIAPSYTKVHQNPPLQ